MSKGRKNRGPIPQFNRGKNIPVRTHTVPIQQRFNKEKKKMRSVLSFEESLMGKIDELFNINLEGIHEGKEPIFFSTAIFSIDDADSAIAKIEQLPDVDCTEESKTGLCLIWTRAYPKGHWNPMSNQPGARQILGNIQINYDNTLKLETKTKGWMTSLIYYIINTLGNDIRLTSLEFKSTLDFLK
jgi:hypothetical protein